NEIDDQDAACAGQNGENQKIGTGRHSPSFRMKRFSALSLQTFAAQAAGLACGLASGVVIARTLGPSAKGAVAVYTLIAGFLALAGRLGLDMANVYLVAKGEIAPRRAWANSLAVSAAGTILVIVVFFAAPMLGIVIQRPLDMGLLSIALVSVPLAVMFDLQLNLMQGMGDIGGSNRAGLARQMLRLAALALIVVALRGATAGALWSVNAALIGANLWCLSALWRKGAAALIPGWPELKRALAYGLKSLPGQLIQFFNYRLDILLLAYFWTNREVGIYSVAVFMAELVWHIPQAMITVLMPRVSAAGSQRDGLAVTYRAIRHTVLWSVLCAAGLALAAPWLISRLYGSPFAPAVSALWILLAGVTALAPGKLAVVHLAGIGKPQYYTYMALAGIGLSIVFDLALIPRFGIAGAAAASAAAYGASGAMALYWLRARTNASLRQSLFMQRDDWRHYARLVPEFLRDLS
ncbi:MAG: oligosaccharide flippase family protein, partial [Candidatus Edwardsbacteria bacterium]|nr:oligosaccharide flippase family protein [Candidatus Edwardsbacteria bacterium]